MGTMAISEALRQSTLAEVAHMDAAGMERITPEELTARLDAIGYRADQDVIHNYVNGYNERPYAAKSMGYKNVRTGLSFAHVDDDRTNLPALQLIRFNCYVLSRGRIWEL